MSLNTWLGSQPTAFTAGLAATRAALAWQRIQEKPSSVVFTQANGTKLAAQTVRIESDSRISMPQAMSGTAPKRQVIIFGIKDHPTLPDTDIREGYTFNLDRDRYVVKDVIKSMLGEIQAITEASR